jgi:hypothetical protein
MDEDFVKFMFGFVAVVVGIGLVIYAIMIAIAAAAFVAMLVAGIMSVKIVQNETGRLVKAESAPVAFILSLGWASVLTTGCILGSFALFWALALSEGDALGSHMSGKYGEVYDFKGFMLNVYNWLIVGAYAFFLKTAIVIYLANRIFVARNSGGGTWLGIIPAVAAMLIFFLADHWELVLKGLNSRDHLETLWHELRAVIMSPIELGLELLRNPDAVLRSSIEKFKESDGSIFKLGKEFPKIFWVIAIAYGVRALTGNIDVVPSN